HSLSWSLRFCRTSRRPSSPAGKANFDRCFAHKASRGRVGEVAKVDPHVASGRTGKIFPPDLLVLLREVRVDAVGVECERVLPRNLSSFWINLKTRFLAQREPNFPLLVCHHVLTFSLLCSCFRP